MCLQIKDKMDKQKNKNRLAIVPARSGSKRFPGKNSVLLGGKPLIFHTLDVLLNSKCFKKIIFSTDSLDMIEMVKKEYGEKIYCSLRPEELCTDTTKVIKVVEFYYDVEVENQYSQANPAYNQVWLSLPTCPLKTVEDVEGCVQRLEDDTDSVLTVTDCEFPPTLSLKPNQDGTFEEWPNPHFSINNSRSQDQLKLYRPNGALYGAKWNIFNVTRNFYRGKKVCYYYMPRERSVDIDTKLDFEYAEFLLERGYK